MDDLAKFLRLRQSLKSDVDSCKMFRQSPGWFKDRVLAIDYRVDLEDSWEFSEMLLSEAFHDGTHRDYFFLSLLEDCDSRVPLEADFGAGRFIRQGQPGNLVFGDDETVVRMQGIGPYHSCMIYIKKEVVHEYFRTATQGREVSPERLLSKSFRDEVLRVLMKQLIIHARTAPETGRRMVQQHLQTSILQRLLELAGNVDRAPSDAALLQPGGLKNVVDYMHANYAQDLSLDQLAQQAGVSRGHFVRLFRQTLGESPKQYLMKLRLERAKTLLASPTQMELSVLQIAQSCGYCDQSHLSREFRQAFGVTPGAFRQSLLG
ncbi:AraC family transcriptional regulator [Blastopirellula sp. JC732]|uniref:AraC family transcriptional regulator n=1 Tax=Blastopirellula sediminis TaxID=2894196 RepID=A0A9X1SHN9_9BACT|nr:AraC family transcriptional regulator [Blastopirellula sediminis]MCC9607848.1 AraC family transcriptional regulator [Blastopirellula sediminis]MCC9627359.1 AraC family transcriptional regulator [Blastopirellula sediminis]